MATSLFDRANQLAEKSVYKPTTQSFDESKGVEGRTNSIMSKGSPLMKTAATQAAQSANARGLRNSSMAVQSGQQAVINSAVPIASADAQLYQNNTLANQNAKNTAGQSNSQLRATVGMQGLQLGETSRQFDTTAGLERDRLAESSRQFNVSDATSNRQFNVQTEARAKEVAGQLGLNYAQLSAQDKQQLRELAMQDKQLTQDQKQFDATGLLERARLNESTRQFNVGEQGQNQRFNTELAERARQADAQLKSQQTIASLDRASQEKLATIDNEFKAELSGNEKLSGAYGSMVDAISRIQTNAELTGANKTKLIQDQINTFEQYAKFTKKSTGIDVSELLRFTTTPTTSTAKPTTPTPVQVVTPKPGTPGTPGYDNQDWSSGA